MTNSGEKLSRCALIALLALSGATAHASGELGPYIGELLKRHPSVRAAQSNSEGAAHDVRAARLQYLPTPSVGIEKASRSKLGSSLTDNTTSYARLQQPIWTAGKLGGQVERAQFQLQYADATVQEQKQNIALRFLELVADYRLSIQRANAYADNVEKQQSYTSQVRARAREGLTAQSDVTLSESRLSVARAEHTLASFQRSQALARLEELWGGALPFEVREKLEQFEVLDAGPDGVAQQISESLRSALQYSPTVEKARLAKAVAEAEARLSKARMMPDVYLRAELRKGDVSGTDRQIFIGLSSSFGGGVSGLASADASQARAQAADSEIEARQRELAEQVTSDVLLLGNQLARSRNLESAISASRSYLQATENQFQAGRRSWLDVLNAARDTTGLVIQRAEAVASAWLSNERLKIRCQGLKDYMREQEE